MKTFILCVAMWGTLMVTTLEAGDFAPESLLGYVMAPDPISPVTMTFVTEANGYSYELFSDGRPRRRFVYAKQTATTAKFDEYDPTDDETRWFEGMFIFSSAQAGACYDLSDNSFAGNFTIVAPSPPTLDIVRQAPGNVVIGVNSQVGQRIILEQSTDLLSWSAISTNISTTGRLEISRSTPGPVVQSFYRAYIPTQ